MNMSDNVHIKKLIDFLNKHVVKGEGECTHTAFGPPWGKFYIGDNDLQSFLNIYKKALMAYNSEGIQPTLHIIERPKRVGPKKFKNILNFHRIARTKYKKHLYLKKNIQHMMKNKIIIKMVFI